MTDAGFDPAEFSAFKSSASPPPDATAQDTSTFDPNEFSAFKAQQPAMSWGDAATSAAKNIVPSAGRFASDIAQPFIHPIDTATNIKNLGQGVLQKAGIISGDDHEQYADAVGQFFADRYGGLENAKRTFATDPVGMAGDLSMVLTGGETALARMPGALSRLGEMSGTAARALDPINAASKVAGVVGKGASEVIGGLGTNTGGQSLRIAANAGYEGGDAAKAFRDNMRGTAPMEDTVAAAKLGLQNIRTERGDLYRQQMATSIQPDKTILDFGDVDKALNKIKAVKTFKGQSLSPTTEAIRTTLTDTINDWRDLDPAEFHTPEGLDALKQKIGDIRDGTEVGTPERTVANQVYNAVRGSIVDQVPAYAKIMKGYEDATNQVREIEKTLSLPADNKTGPTIDTSLRKLQSILRDNVNTSYGRRGELAQYLVDNGAPNLMERLAGQALKPWIPRGLGRLGMQIAVEMGAAGVGAATVGAHALPAVAATMPFMSPRLMGEAAYAAGTAARPFKNVPVGAIATGARQVGRLNAPIQSAPPPASVPSSAVAAPNQAATAAPLGAGTTAAPFQATTQSHIDWFKNSAPPGSVISVNGKLYRK